MTTYNKEILAAAGRHMGLEEWPGAKHNPAIVQMFSDVGHGWVQDDETSWCAAFVGSVLAELGLPHTGKLTARSYEAYGAPVRTQDARPGDIVVLWRGSPTSWQGHVGFFVEFSGNRVVLRGGNQGNKVSDQAYDMSRVVAIRRADGLAPKGNRPVLREGDVNEFVRVLQARLHELGYMVGRQDGKFGSRTLGAVTAFQSDNSLVVDGKVGDRTWDALETAKQRPLRKVALKDGTQRLIQLDDLKEKSRTIQKTQEGKKQVSIGGAIAGGGVVLTQIEEVSAAVREAQGLMQLVSGMAPTVLIVMAFLLVVWIIYNQFNAIEEIRVDDAQTGVNDRI